MWVTISIPQKHQSVKWRMPWSAYLYKLGQWNRDYMGNIFPDNNAVMNVVKRWAVSVGIDYLGVWHADFYASMAKMHSRGTKIIYVT